MWHLDAYDNESDFLAESYPLRGATSTTIKELIGADEKNGPIEAAMHEVAHADLSKFVKYIDVKFSINLGYTYFIGLFAD